MPTKPNRAGQQQNYVPQGNGDASGEYADQASGSNKHFTNFKKPDEEKTVIETNEQVKSVETPTQETASTKYKDDNGYEWNTREKHDFYISLITSGIFKHVEDPRASSLTPAKLKKIIDNASEDALQAISKTMRVKPFEFIEDRHNAGTSYYYPYGNQIHLNEATFGREFENPGSSMFHEIGHYLNDQNKIRENVKWYSQTVKMTDAQTIFDDGKSVAETLQEELKEFSLSKVAPKIRKEKYNFVNPKLKPYGFTAQEYEALAEDLKVAKEDPEWQHIKAQIKSDWDNGRFRTINDANEELRTQFEIWKMTGPYKDKYQQMAKWRPFYADATNEWYRTSGIHAVSDVWSSKSNFGFGLGHNREYYKKTWQNPNPESTLADEFFANVFGAYTTGSETVLETTKKYFPRTYEKVLKLVERLNAKG